MKSVGQISAQARQPMQSGGGWWKGGAISRPQPRLTDEIADTPIWSQTRVQRPHRMQSSGSGRRSLYSYGLLFSDLERCRDSLPGLVRALPVQEVVWPVVAVWLKGGWWLIPAVLA